MSNEQETTNKASTTVNSLPPQVDDIVSHNDNNSYPPRGIVISKSDGALMNESSSAAGRVIREDDEENPSNLLSFHHPTLSSSQSSYSFPGDYQQPQPGISSPLSDSLASLLFPNFAQQLSATIMSGLNWINQINATTLFQNFLSSGLFGRRRPSPYSPQHGNTGQQQATNSPPSSLTANADSFYSQFKFAKILNGTIRLHTLKPSELIELSSFGLVELDKDVEPGIGHEFQRYENDTATWCDSCGEFLFPSVMNNNSSSNMIDSAVGQNPNAATEDVTRQSSNQTTSMASVQADHLIRTYFQCTKCKYVCHWKCLNLIRIDCQPRMTTVAANADTTNGAISPSDSTSDDISSLLTETDNNNNNNDDDDGDEEATIMNTSNEDVFGATTASNMTDDCSRTTLNNADSKVLNASIDSNDNTTMAADAGQQPLSTNKSQPHSYLITPSFILDLRAKILRYNERVRSKGSGLGITLIDEEKGLFRGFLRVHMNLTRPINVIAGKRPPSIYDIINEEENNQQRRTLTSFYMPRDTVRNIHITSDSTSLQVIKAMLKKFKVVDNPQKFALYLRRRFPEEELRRKTTADGDGDGGGGPRISDDTQNELTLSKFLKTAGHDHSLKRLHDHEKPLILQLEFDNFAYGSVDIVMQENDNADIAWEAFEVPELRNFLKILEREEGEHLEHVKAHYREMKRILQALIDFEEARRLQMSTINDHPSNTSNNGGNDSISAATAR